MLQSVTISASLQFANFLSPLLRDTYAAITTYAGQQLQMATELVPGHDLSDFGSGRVDVGFLCGLLYVHLRATQEDPVELLAAPVLRGTRYQGRPQYFSDVVVRRDSRWRAFADLGGSTWAYNEEASHSGYNLVQYSLLERQGHTDYFGRTVKSGSHAQSLQLVLSGQADAAAIDSHVLEVMFQQDPQLAAQLHSIDMLGPSAIPPIVVARKLPRQLKQALRDILAHMHEDPVQAELLHAGKIERLVTVQDEDYTNIRAMWNRVQTARQQSRGFPDAKQVLYTL
ncbi:hypothetical protein KDA_14670 [Dictyobacter alpinus]|uniref:Phosphate ABC transporter substrate-binding protein n=1 Tax=Dictyobacter alpinus TaxID=2014873 RepID=A0A402B3Q7_9CHLR|nr:PhnD/SsuA/transferrin family substrate-binding protein [Dictyobacter alpinus]GCE25983.1 hypothetical protein KDA_14670 [Dictyobacter alpinus]